MLPEHRRCGVGGRLLSHVAKIAVERGYTRLGWAALWTGTSWRCRFYRKIGATVLDEWTSHRLSGARLRSSGGREPAGAVTDSRAVPLCTRPARVGPDRRHRLRWSSRAHRAAARGSSLQKRGWIRRTSSRRRSPPATCSPARPRPSSRSSAPTEWPGGAARSSAALRSSSPAVVMRASLLSLLFLASARRSGSAVPATAPARRRRRRGRRPAGRC